jgi:hypothetical protein
VPPAAPRVPPHPHLPLLPPQCHSHRRPSAGQPRHRQGLAPPRPPATHPPWGAAACAPPWGAAACAAAACAAAAATAAALHLAAIQAAVGGAAAMEAGSWSTSHGGGVAHRCMCLPTGKVEAADGRPSGLAFACFMLWLLLSCSLALATLYSCTSSASTRISTWVLSLSTQFLAF